MRVSLSKSGGKNFPHHPKRLNNSKLKSPVRIWAFDEHRVGLAPTQRQAWFPGWEVPIAPFCWKFEWSWIYGFVEPETGETDWFIMPRVNHLSLSMFLQEFARPHHIDHENPAVIVVDKGYNEKWCME